MEFYTVLSNVYDNVFPLEEDIVKFLSEDLKPGDNVLDLACGTGQYSIELGKLDSNVTGIDLNGDMIRIAKEKAGNLNIEFLQEDMTRFDNINDKKYNLIFCIGNSIVHLDNMRKIERFIKDIYNSLERNGIMVIQTINFDRILKYNIKSLPTIDRSDIGVKFIRKYNFNKGDDKLEFNTELTIRRGSAENKYFNIVPLIMLLKNEAVSMIERAGFGKIEVYGGFNKKEYSEEAYAMVIKATKE